MAALERSKAINDRFGQNSGDGVIWAFAAVCPSAVRAADLVGCCGSGSG